MKKVSILLKCWRFMKMATSYGNVGALLNCRRFMKMLAIWKQIVNEHTSSLLFTTYSCCQQRYEQLWNLFPMVQGTFKTIMLLFSVGNGTLNALR
jgi:hypothetical protein